MTEKELKNLSRMDILELLLRQSKRVKELEGQLHEAEQKLEARSIAIDEAGSIAEAAIRINGVFEAAQLAGQQYLENIAILSQRQESICQKMEEDCQARCLALQSETERMCAELKRQAMADSDEMIAKAREESKAYWDEVSQRLERFYAEHTGLRELLSTLK